MLLKLSIPAGVYANGTPYQGQGRWNDANLVRWNSGYMGPIKGWIKFDSTQLNGRPSDIHQYRDGATRHLAVGTHTKLYGTTALGAITDITPAGYTVGRASRGNAYGYGLGPYGVGLYGVSTPATGTVVPATNWTLDNFGTFLIACANTDGVLYFWDNTTPTATAIPGAPTGNKAVLVTDERFVFALGAAGSNSLVQWSDQEDYTTWTPAATNQAGDFDLQTSGEILNGTRVRGQVLILTTADAHTATYQGPPFVYGFECVGRQCGGISPHCMVATDGFAAWMGRSGFFIYDGYVKPLPSDVFDLVYSNINQSQADKVHGWNNTAVGEIWWHYPSSDSIECDRYVVWNYRENHWTVGRIDRTAGSDEGVYGNPLMTGSDGYIYSHETGFSYDGAIPYAETSPMEVGDGESRQLARYLYPDEKTQGDVTASFRTRMYPNGPEYSYGPYSLTAPTPVRFTGRQIVMRITSARNADWRFGIPRLDLTPNGSR